MKAKTRVFEVRQEVVRHETTGTERIIFEFDGENKVWKYKAPNAQEHTEEQLEEILKKLKELNKEV